MTWPILTRKDTGVKVTGLVSGTVTDCVFGGSRPSGTATESLEGNQRSLGEFLLCY